jgi:hypothetical protein
MFSLYRNYKIFTANIAEIIQSRRMSWVWNVVRRAEITASTFKTPKSEDMRPPWNLDVVYG